MSKVLWNKSAQQNYVKLIVTSRHGELLAVDGVTKVVPEVGVYSLQKEKGPLKVEWPY